MVINVLNNKTLFSLLPSQKSAWKKKQLKFYEKLSKSISFTLNLQLHLTSPCAHYDVKTTVWDQQRIKIKPETSMRRKTFLHEIDINYTPDSDARKRQEKSVMKEKNAGCGKYYTVPRKVKHTSREEQINHPH